MEEKSLITKSVFLTEELSGEYKLRFDLKNDIELEICMFSWREMRWFFSYSQIIKDTTKVGAKPDFVNKIKLNVDYIDGIAQKIDVSMEMIWPERRGQRSYLGVDISPGSKLFIELSYSKMKEGEGEYFKLLTMEATPGGSIDISKIEPNTQELGLMNAVELPFVISTRIPLEYGVYNIPFLDSKKHKREFEVRKSIIKIY
ncbi:MAG: hypothetical protein AAB870_01965 [Patescibacteria group bacterium]